MLVISLYIQRRKKKERLREPGTVNTPLDDEINRIGVINDVPLGFGLD